MITLFALPKPFTGPIAVLQRNALQSWQRLSPEVEIFLGGKDPGIAEAAEEFGLQYLPEIAVNEFGTPRLPEAFEIVQQQARYPVVGYVNADIVLLSDFLACVKRIPFKDYLMVGQRWNLDIDVPLPFDQPDWEAQLRRRVAQEGEFYGPLGIDYFVFPCGSIRNMPAFSVGRPGWDNWMIYQAVTRQIPVIDATQANLVVHQNHDYSHVPRPKVPGSWEGPEADRNRELMGGRSYLFNLSDATHLLTPDGVVSTRWMRPYLKRRVMTLGTRYPRMRPLVQAGKRVLYWFGWRPVRQERAEHAGGRE